MVVVVVVVVVVVAVIVVVVVVVVVTVVVVVVVVVITYHEWRPCCTEIIQNIFTLMSLFITHATQPAGEAITIYTCIRKVLSSSLG